MHIEEDKYVQQARASGDIAGVVRAGLMAFSRVAVDAAAFGVMLAACWQWWGSINRGREIDWAVVERAEALFGWDILSFMQAIGLA